MKSALILVEVSSQILGLDRPLYFMVYIMVSFNFLITGSEIGNSITVCLQ